MAKPVTTERSIWAGLRTEQVADLEISAGEKQTLRSWEREVANVVDGVLDGGAVRLSDFRDRIKSDRTVMSGRFTRFKEDVSAEVEETPLVRLRGASSR